jgi:hypothetical protein
MQNIIYPNDCLCLLHFFSCTSAPPYPAGLSRLEPPFTYPVIHKIVKRLSLAAAALILIKAIPSLVALLGAQQLLSDALDPHLPERVLSTLLTNTCEGSSELMCGAKLCCMVSGGCAACAYRAIPQR